jgi:hypothetical protein
MLEKILLRFGYVKLPKVKDGQYLRHPTVCKNPVRKPKCDVTNPDPLETEAYQESYQGSYIPF